MSKTLQALVSQAQGHIKAADEQAVPVNLALLARNQAEFNAALVDARGRDRRSGHRGRRWPG